MCARECDQDQMRSFSLHRQQTCSVVLCCRCVALCCDILSCDFVVLCCGVCSVGLLCVVCGWVLYSVVVCVVHSAALNVRILMM